MPAITTKSTAMTRTLVLENPAMHSLASSTPVSIIKEVVTKKTSHVSSLVNISVRNMPSISTMVIHALAVRPKNTIFSISIKKCIYLPLYSIITIVMSSL